MQRKQFLVKISNEIEGNKFIKYLEDEGFENIHKVTFDKLRVKVLVIDGKTFFSTNTTCLAALASCKIKPLSIEDFLNIYNLNMENYITL